MAIKSTDLGLDEKIIQENHYHTWDYHLCHFEANINIPPTFMICGINFLKMLIRILKKIEVCTIQIKTKEELTVLDLHL